MSKNNVLYLYDSDQMTFGKLSPLYRSKVMVGIEEASNIISYCYAGLIKPGGIKNSILSESGKEAQITSLKEFKEEREQIFLKSINEGLLEMIRQNEEAQDILYNSGNSIIIYESPFTLLGVNDKGEGQNKVGNMLMGLRKIVNRERVENIQKRVKYNIENAKYNVYTVYNALQQKIQSGVDNLERYLNKSPEEIINILKLKPFPGSFDIELDSDILDLFLNKRDIAKYLREIYAEEYNEAVLELQKIDLLKTYFINKALKALPPKKNYDELYARYQQLKLVNYTDSQKEQGENQEYQELSKIFRPVSDEIRDLLEQLSQNSSLKELSDRVYILASKGLIDVNIEPLDKLPVPKANESVLRKHMENTKKILEDLKRLNALDQEKERAKAEEEAKSLESKIKKYKEDEIHNLRIQKFYMKKAKTKVMKDYYKRKGIRESDQDEDEDEDEDADQSSSIYELYEYYEKNYPGLFDEIKDMKKQMLDEVEIENWLLEYQEKNPKAPVQWTRKSIFDKKYFLKKNEFEYLQAYGGGKFDENFVKDYLKNMEKQSESEEKYNENPKILRFSDESPLSPYYNNTFEVKHFVFPSVFHYVYYKLLLNILYVILKEISSKENPIKYAHDLLLLPVKEDIEVPLFKSIQDITSIYLQTLEYYKDIVLKNRAIKALYYKFRDVDDSKMVKLLIASNPKVLVYNNDDDLILGTGPIRQGKYEGQNFIGKLMTEIRDNLVIKYGEISLSKIDMDMSPRRIVKNNIILTEYARNKIREIVYVFIIYCIYIKETRIITLENAKFVIDQLYYKSSEKLKKIEKTIKIPKMNREFKEDVENLTNDAKFKIDKNAMDKLWSYIYVFSELVDYEIKEKELNKYRLVDIIRTPIDYETVGQFIGNIEYEPKEFFINSVKDAISKYGSICVGMGLIAENKKDRIETKCLPIDNDDSSNLEKLSGKCSIKLLESIKDGVAYDEFYVSIYSTDLSMLRTDYVHKLEKECSDLIKTEDKKENCVLDVFINILKMLQANKDINMISYNSISFVNLLLSTTGNIEIFSQPDVINNIKSRQLTKSSDDNIKTNELLVNIFKNRVGLSFMDKFSGKYNIDIKDSFSRTLSNLSFSNSVSFGCNVSISILLKSGLFTSIYQLKYRNEIMESSLESGNDIGVLFTLNTDKKIEYKLPNYGADVDQITIEYTGVSIIKSTNILYFLKTLAKSTNSMARVLSFGKESIFKKIEESIEKDEDIMKEIRKKSKKKKKLEDSDISERESEEQKEDIIRPKGPKVKGDIGEGEEDEDEDEGLSSYDASIRGSDEEEDESDGGDYYEEEEDE